MIILKTQKYKKKKYGKTVCPVCNREFKRKFKIQLYCRKKCANIAKPIITLSDPKQRYKDYLNSPQWKTIRNLVLERDKSKCECGAIATQVHHLIYTEWGQEPLNNLISVCQDCHNIKHGINK